MADRKPRYARVTDDPAVKEHIRRLVDEAPPLSTSQIARLRVLFATVQPVDMREAA